MAAEVRINIVTTASGGGAQVIKDLNDIDSAAKNAGGGFSVLSGAAAAALGGVVVSAASAAAGAITNFVGGSITAAGDFEGAVNNLAAISGSALADAGFSFDDVSAKALQLGQDTAFSASESIAAMTELVKGGVPIVDVMGEATDATLALAAASGTELASAAEIVSKQLGVWGDTGVEATQVADLLTQAANASTVGVEDLALGLANSAGTAKTAGVEFDELVQTMALIAPGFSSASDAGTSLKTMLSRLIPTTTPAKDAMFDLGLWTRETGSAFYDTTGSFIGMEAAAGLLQEATAGLSEEQRLLALQTIFGQDAIRAAAYIAEAGAEGFADMGASMAAAGTAAETAAIQNQGFNFAMDSLYGTIETVQIQLGSLLLPYLTALVQTTTSVINAVMGNADAFAALSPPLQAVVAWVQSLVPIAMELGAVIASNWQPILAAAAGIITALVVPALASMVVAIAPVLAVVGAAIAIGMALQAAWSSNFMNIQGITTAAMAAINSVITSVMGIVLTFWQNNGTQIMTFAQTTWTTIQTIIGTIAAGIAQIVTTVFSAIAGFLNQHGATIQSLLTFAWNSIQNIITLALNTIQGITNTVLGVLTGNWQQAGDGIRQIVSGLGTFLSAQWENMKRLVIELGPKLLSAATDVGKAIVDGIASGISSGAGAIVSAAKDAAKRALDAAKSLLGIKSPSSVFAQQVGLPISQGLAAGITMGAPAVAAAGAGVAASAYRGGRSTVSTSNRTVNYTANFNGVGASRTSDAIARSLAAV